MYQKPDRSDTPWLPYLRAVARHAGADAVESYLCAHLALREICNPARAMAVGESTAQHLLRLCETETGRRTPSADRGPGRLALQHLAYRLPLPHLCPETRAGVYFCRLFPTFRREETDRFGRDLEQQRRRHVDTLLDFTARLGAKAKALLDDMGPRLTADLQQVDSQNAFTEGMLLVYRRVLATPDPADGRPLCALLLEGEDLGAPPQTPQAFL